MPTTGPPPSRGSRRGRTGPSPGSRRIAPRNRQGFPTRSNVSSNRVALNRLRGQGNDEPLRKPTTTFFRGVLKAASLPAYAVGNAAGGDFGETAKIASLFGGPFSLAARAALTRNAGALNPISTFKSVKEQTVSDALEKRGLISKKGAKGFGLSLGIDIITDPLTYVSFGTAGAARAAIGSAAAAKLRSAAQTTGRKPTFREAAEIFGEAALEKHIAPKRFTVGFRVPFTRGKTKDAELFTVSRGGKDPRRPADSSRTADLRNTLGEAFVSTRGASKPIREIYQSLRRMAESERFRIAKRSRALDKAIRAREKELGLSRGAGASAITRHLDNPGQWDAPEGFQDIIEDAKTMLDEIDELENLEGIDRGFRSNYVPHLLADRRSLRKFQETRRRTNPGQLDNPFFVQRREFDTLDELIAAGEKEGFKVELNIANLINARANASITARLKKGFDDGVASIYGVKPPRKVVPGVEGARREAAERAAELDALSQKVSKAPARRVVNTTRRAVVAARAKLRAAERTGDLQKVEAARVGIREAELQARLAVQEAIEEARPRLAKLRESREATAANLPKGRGGADVRTTPQTQQQVVEDFAQDLVNEADALEFRHGEILAREAKAKRDAFRQQAKPGGLDRQSAVGGTRRLAPGMHSNEELARHNAAMAPGFRTRNENLRTFDARLGKRRDKTLADFQEEVVDEVMEGIAERGEAAMREMLGDDLVDAVLGMRRAANSRELADNIKRAIRAKRGEKVDPLFPEEDARLAAIFDNIVEELGGTRRPIDAAGRRARAAKRSEEALNEAGFQTPGQPEVALNKAQTRTGRAAVRRYFDQGKIPESGIARDVETIETEIDAIRALHQRRVSNAQRRLKRAQKSKSTQTIKSARKELRDAQRAERKATRALDSVDGRYVGTPRQVRAATKRQIKAEAKLARTERAAADVVEYNKVLDARPGRLAVSREEYDDLLETWREIADADRYHNGTIIPGKVAEDVRKVHAELMPQVKDVNALSNAGIFLNDLTRRWKALALTSLGFHLRNLQDDGLRAYWAGARNPASFVSALKALRYTERKMSGKAVGKGGTVTISKGAAKGTYTYDEIIDLMETYGVIRTGFARAELTSIEGETFKVSRRVVEAPGTGRIARFSQQVGQYREDMTRGGLFIELLKRGDDPLEAAEITRRYLFDYGDVSQVISGARRYWMPFIVFPSKAIPNTARVFASRPGIPANLNLAIENLDDAAGNPDLSYLDLQQASSFALPVPDKVKAALGLPQDDDVLFDPKFVMGASSLDLLDPRAGTRNVTDMLSPFITVPVEVTTQKSLFTGRDFPKTGARAPRQLSEAARIPGIGGAIAKAVGFREDARNDFFTGDPIDTYNARIDAILRGFPPWGQTDAYTGGSRNSQNRLIRSLTGLSVKPAERARRQAAIEQFGED